MIINQQMQLYSQKYETCRYKFLYEGPSPYLIVEIEGHQAIKISIDLEL